MIALGSKVPGLMSFHARTVHSSPGFIISTLSSLEIPCLLAAISLSWIAVRVLPFLATWTHTFFLHNNFPISIVQFKTYWYMPDTMPVMFNHGHHRWEISFTMSNCAWLHSLESHSPKLDILKLTSTTLLWLEPPKPPAATRLTPTAVRVWPLLAT